MLFSRYENFNIENLPKRELSPREKASSEISSVVYSRGDADVVNSLKEELGVLSNKLLSFDNKIDEIKSNIVETLGIFVALFTFISADIQIFRFNISFLSAVGYTIITLGSLLFFVFILYLIVDGSKIDSGKIGAGLIIVFVLITSGIFMVLKDFKDYTKVFDSYVSTTTEKFYTKEELNSLILENKKNTETLNCLKIKGWFDQKCFNN